MSHKDLVQSYVDAWNAHDPEGVAGHFAEDGVRHWHVAPIMGGPTRFEGPVEIAAGVKAFMDAAPDLTVEVVTTVETDWGGILEWRVRGTHTGVWEVWTPQGEEVDFSGVSIYRIANGKLAEERMYFDPDVMTRNWKPPEG